MEIFHEWWVELGGVGVLVAFLLWVAINYQRYVNIDHEAKQNAMDLCIEEKQSCLEQLACQRKEMIEMMREHREELKSINKQQAKAIENNTAALSKLCEIVRHCQAIADRRDR